LTARLELFVEETKMWIRDELNGIRERAELEASINGISDNWNHACLTLASAADRLDAMTDRIERGVETAIAKPQRANAG
jgi:hypothetical protein